MYWYRLQIKWQIKKMYEAKSIINTVLSHGQSQPLHFSGAKFLFNESLVLTPNSHSHILQQHEASHRTLLSIGSGWVSLLYHNVIQWLNAQNSGARKNDYVSSKCWKHCPQSYDVTTNYCPFMSLYCNPTLSETQTKLHWIKKLILKCIQNTWYSTH
jgi:hypothetical protein